MTAAATCWSEETVRLNGAAVRIVKGGSGPPLLVLHDEMGFEGRLRSYEALALHHTVYLPLHPGFEGSERLDWIMTVRDLAAWYLQALDELALGPVPLLGCSLGGWLAAELAALDPHLFTRLALVAPMGIKPPSGEIFDMFLVTARQYIPVAFHDPEGCDEYRQLYGEDPSPAVREARETAREQACRLAWKPYMYDPALPFLLRRAASLPLLVVWGKQDAVVPVQTAEAWRQALPGARVALLEGCGHRPEIEQSAELVRLVEGLLG
jgi:pimeloyl-ACP methyl ester carboxylesterase